MRLYSYLAALWLSLPILVILIYGVEWFNYDVFEVMIAPVILTLVASGIAVGVTVVIFTPLSFYLARRRNAFLESRGLLHARGRLVEAVVLHRFARG